MQFQRLKSELVEIPDKIRTSPTFNLQRPCFTSGHWEDSLSSSSSLWKLAAEDTVARHIGDHRLHDLLGSDVPAYPETFGSRQTGQGTPRSTRAMVSSAASLLLCCVYNYIISILRTVTLQPCYQCIALPALQAASPHGESTCITYTYHHQLFPDANVRR